MTAHKCTTQEVEQRLDTQRADLLGRLAELKSEHGAAALKAAEGDTAALHCIPEINRTMQELSDTLASVEAAQSALDARKAEEQRAKKVADLQAAAEQVPALAAEMLENWDQLTAALEKMGEAWQAFEASRIKLGDVSWICATAAQRRPGEVVLTQGMHSSTARQLAGKILWHATNGEIEPNVHHPRDPGAVREAVANQVATAVSRAKASAATGLGWLQR